MAGIMAGLSVQHSAHNPGARAPRRCEPLITATVTGPGLGFGGCAAGIYQIDWAGTSPLRRGSTNNAARVYARTGDRHGLNGRSSRVRSVT